MTSKRTTPFFAHERLYVYRLALEFTAFCDTLYASWPHGRADLKNQLSRASDSILLNIAEASGRRHAGQSGGSFFGIAIGSAAECAAILDRIEVLGVPELEAGRRQLLRITAMLYGLFR